MSGPWVPTRASQPRTCSGKASRSVLGSFAMAEDDIIALSRFRAALSRARGTRRVEELLADPLAPSLVPTLPVLDLFYLIKEVGLEESQELVAMSSAEQ